MTKLLVFSFSGAYLGSIIAASLNMAQREAATRFPDAERPLQFNEKWKVTRVDDFKRRLPRRRMVS